MASQFSFQQRFNTCPNKGQGAQKGQFRQSRSFSPRFTIRRAGRHSMSRGGQTRSQNTVQSAPHDSKGRPLCQSYGSRHYGTICYRHTEACFSC